MCNFSFNPRPHIPILLTLIALFFGFLGCQKDKTGPAAIDQPNFRVPEIEKDIMVFQSFDEMDRYSSLVTKDKSAFRSIYNCGFESLLTTYNTSVSKRQPSDNPLVAHYEKFPFKYYSLWLNPEGIVKVGDVLVRFTQNQVITYYGDDLKELADYTPSVPEGFENSKFFVSSVKNVVPVSDRGRNLFEYQFSKGHCEQTNAAICTPANMYKQQTELTQHTWATGEKGWQGAITWHYKLEATVSLFAWVEGQWVDYFPFDESDHITLLGNFVRTSYYMGNASGDIDFTQNPLTQSVYSFVIDQASWTSSLQLVPLVTVTGHLFSGWGVTPIPNPGCTYFIHCQFDF